MTDSFSAVGDLPVIIIGAGISGLLLAQQLRKLEIPFQIFEREKDVLTRGAGWGCENYFQRIFWSSFPILT
jgi:2-polyprenyl-6-methoxyphenol hydroxylase-like FAD-dependent oxidoreductase